MDSDPLPPPSNLLPPVPESVQEKASGEGGASGQEKGQRKRGKLGFLGSVFINYQNSGRHAVI